MTATPQPAPDPTARPVPQAMPATDVAARHAADKSIGDLVHEVSTSVSTLVQREIELAKLELRSTVKNAGVGVGLFAAAAVLLVFSLTFGLIALAEGLIAAGLYRWLGYLIVFVLLLLVIGALAFLGYKKVKRVRAPQQTIDAGKQTVAYLKNHPNPSDGAARR